MGSDNAFLAVEEGMFSMDDSFAPYDHFAPFGPGSKPVKFPALHKPLPKGPYAIAKGWRVDGVFLDEDTIHGLIFNPHIKTWFHVWWNRQGKCLTGNCQDGQWDLTLP